LELYFGFFGLLFFEALLWAFWCGKLWKEKELLKGRIVEGKMLKRG
jgi:hypothetical protein